MLLWPQRLKNWELRERKKARDYAKESEREDERRREMVRAHWAPTDVYRDVLLRLNTSMHTYSFNKPEELVIMSWTESVIKKEFHNSLDVQFTNETCFINVILHDWKASLNMHMSLCCQDGMDGLIFFFCTHGFINQTIKFVSRQTYFPKGVFSTVLCVFRWKRANVSKSFWKTTMMTEMTPSITGEQRKKIGTCC